MNARNSMDLQAALRKLESWQSQPPAAGQRRFERFPARGEARLFPGEAGLIPPAVPTVHIRDVSRGGIGILANQPAKAGTFWQVQLGTERLVVASLPGFCRFCREVIPGAYLVGLAFGIDAGILLSLGVPAKSISERDESQQYENVTGEFVDPASFIGDEDAA
ncbi:MAG: PilZ domain-containing protein [Planctomycetota bacterium]|nr:PilZ domain-containing protein [Planctomycetota bacterium]